ncbi:MAG TPA: RNA 2'-phosphotransferase [Erwinia persicina]|uniref:Probable RNA 2'-phosphotransferase n=1 Tax=Erwinia persicina TaxID=55211 RepID=A0A4U3FK86_9GAMM|nr:RNA 2'-phosphotransferase [Erwinia persicina]MBC3945677.1 RNA 2'-phosphotransferase [Erwinia persicina]MBD8107447.1 RNA 2'-phosphotransferase [Erwinia persicina]MBD8166201.1 RNA 2'-phosphotransferase [Erwinia persicina]MBD8210641.1 RNA 2'-phosphotransferase [Erwinia persicina]TKJ93139.1 RNA 2'-phosphotransferase [Erwinia persicina]
MSQSLSDVSKFLSYVLRHQPEAIGLTLDSEGWADIDTLIACAKNDSKSLTRETILSIVESSDKKRFSLSEDGLKIRAVQGHSSQQVDINYQESTPPDVLYHGTATRFLESILIQGLISGSRQYVHLSADEATANSVGQRHGKPTVLKIDALAMHKQGMKFYQADNGVWLTKAVASTFIIQ